MLPLTNSATTSGMTGSGGDTGGEDGGARLPRQTEVWDVLFIQYLTYFANQYTNNIYLFASAQRTREMCMLLC